MCFFVLFFFLDFLIKGWRRFSNKEMEEVTFLFLYGWLQINLFFLYFPLFSLKLSAITWCLIFVICVIVYLLERAKKLEPSSLQSNEVFHYSFVSRKDCQSVWLKKKTLFSLHLYSSERYNVLLHFTFNYDQKGLSKIN